MKAEELSIKYHQAIRELKGAQQMVLVSNHFYYRARSLKPVQFLIGQKEWLIGRRVSILRNEILRNQIRNKNR